MKVGKLCRLLISGNVYMLRNMTNPYRIGEGLEGISTLRKYVRSHTRVCVCVCVCVCVYTHTHTHTLRYKPVGSLGFFIDNFPAALWSWGRLNLCQK